MGHIKEPNGIDFSIQSPPLTDGERKEISSFIKDYKKKHKTTLSKKKKRTNA
ncbi:MAG: hypothetical protein PF481_00595 [Bacteroidales bacterium]|jgi:hypothetical protein|nr:hypothetical protein [Bacteroidales bacterium]